MKKALGIKSAIVKDSDSENSEEDQFGFNQGDKKGDKGSKKQSNTIMQQINSFSLTPMNDLIAKQTIIDHKYLLELVENRCAICFFACSNRNQSLYNALVDFIKEEEGGEASENDDVQSQEFNESEKKKK
jgi:hypothetical protein